MEEKTFWKTMNPVRLNELFDAWYKPQRAAEQKPKKTEKKTSLAEYLLKGG